MPLTDDYDYVYWDRHNGICADKDFSIYSIDEGGKPSFIGMSDKEDDDFYNGDDYNSINDIGAGYSAGQNFAFGGAGNSSVAVWSILDDDRQALPGDNLYLELGGYQNGLCYAARLEDYIYDQSESSYDDTPAVKKCEVQCGYIDEQEEFVIKLDEQAIYGNKFSEGKAVVYLDDKVQIIDETGNVLKEIKMKRTLNRALKIDIYSLNGRAYMLYDCYFRDGRAAFYDGEGYGIVDEEGNWIVPPEFDRVTPAGTDNDLFIVELRGRTGVIRLK